METNKTITVISKSIPLDDSALEKVAGGSVARMDTQQCPHCGTSFHNLTNDLEYKKFVRHRDFDCLRNKIQDSTGVHTLFSR